MRVEPCCCRRWVLRWSWQHALSGATMVALGVREVYLIVIKY